MSDYIKREDAIESAKALLFCYGSDNIPDDKLDEYAEEFINDDDNTIVEVVRCKDCKHRYYDKERKLYYCTMYFGLGDVHDENYCSYGERKDDDECK